MESRSNFDENLGKLGGGRWASRRFHLYKAIWVIKFGWQIWQFPGNLSRGWRNRRNPSWFRAWIYRQKFLEAVQNKRLSLPYLRGSETCHATRLRIEGVQTNAQRTSEPTPKNIRANSNTTTPEKCGLYSWHFRGLQEETLLLNMQTWLWVDYNQLL